MDHAPEDFYPCVGICMADPDSGYCLGCGRPPLGSPPIVAEAAVSAPQPANVDANAEADDDPARAP
jgi:hypothetical protein